MEGNCKSCSAPVPSGQKYCSMCVGDIDHGNDGHYRRWAEDQEREHADQEIDPDMGAH